MSTYSKQPISTMTRTQTERHLAAVELTPANVDRALRNADWFGGCSCGPLTEAHVRVVCFHITY